MHQLHSITVTASPQAAAPGSSGGGGDGGGAPTAFLSNEEKRRRQADEYHRKMEEREAAEARGVPVATTGKAQARAMPTGGEPSPHASSSVVGADTTRLEEEEARAAEAAAVAAAAADEHAALRRENEALARAVREGQQGQHAQQLLLAEQERSDPDQAEIEKRSGRVCAEIRLRSRRME